MVGAIAFGLVPGWLAVAWLVGDRRRRALGVLVLAFTAATAAVAGGSSAAGPAEIGALLGCAAHWLVQRAVRAAAASKESP